jgi:hypothetical protein
MDEQELIKMIPELPAGLIDWLKKRGCFKKNWMIFKCGWYRDPLSGEKEKCLDVHCTACGEDFKALRCDVDDEAEPNCGHVYGYRYNDYYEGRVGTSIIKNRKESLCPHCNAPATGVHTSEAGYTAGETQWPIVISRNGDNVILHSYRVMRCFGKEKHEEKWYIDKYEAAIFTPKKAYRLNGWHTGCFNGKVFTGHWELRRKFSDYFGDAPHVYMGGKNVFRETKFENCKFSRYLRSAKKKPYPIGYLRFYSQHPQIENLIMQGYEYLVAEAISSKYHGTYGERCFSEGAIDWHEKSPRKMLGLVKLDFEAVKSAKLSGFDIMRFRELRKKHSAVAAENLCILIQQFGANLIEIQNLYGEETLKIAHYLQKQAGRPNNDNASSMFRIWKDYLDMAKKLSYDLNDPSIRFPRDLKAAHDRLVMAIKYKEQSALIKKFEDMYERLKPLTFEKDGLLIRPAKSENELIKEGKILNHCVGGYGKTHCSGQSIFFIRRKSKPNDPYFTLQLNVDKKCILQNHGRNNVAPPPAVVEFQKFWLENVVKAQANTKSRKNKSARAA